MKLLDKRTKCIVTLGKYKDYESIVKFADAGANVFRLNMSHSDFSHHQQCVDVIRRVIKDKGYSLSILLDTRGPEIRTSDFSGGVALIKKGKSVTVKCSNFELIGDDSVFSVDYPFLSEVLAKGNMVYLDDGRLKLVVTGISQKENEVYLKACNTHLIANRRAVNVPGVDLKMPFLSEFDKKCLSFAYQNRLDYIALSFVNTAADVLSVKKYLESLVKERREQNFFLPRLIAKIEAQPSVRNFDNILEVSDGIMIARGDLSIEIPYFKVPKLQKQWIYSCNLAKKPVIVATQMLESMITNNVPTKAEVTDIFMALWWKADAMMLSAESASGQYPFLSLQTMREVIIKNEVFPQLKLADCEAIAYFSNLKWLNEIFANLCMNQTSVIFIFDEHFFLEKEVNLFDQLASFKFDLLLFFITTPNYPLTRYGINVGVYPLFIDEYKMAKERKKMLNYLKNECRKKVKAISDQQKSLKWSLLVVNSKKKTLFERYNSWKQEDMN